MLEPEELRRYERMADAMVREAGRQDPEGYAQLLAVVRNAEDGIAMAWPQTGYSYARLGEVLGIRACNAQKWVKRRLGVSSLTSRTDG